jgi:hypothetical protein
VIEATCGRAHFHNEGGPDGRWIGAASIRDMGIAPDLSAENYSRAL